MATDAYNATVTQRLEVAPGLIIMRVASDGPLFHFEAGQYTVLGLKRKEPVVAGADGSPMLQAGASGAAPAGESGTAAVVGSDAAPAAGPGAATAVESGGSTAGESAVAAAGQSDAEGAGQATAADDPERLIKRAYSIASSSQASAYVEFYLTLVSSGELTPRLFALREGGRLFMGPKATGVFTLARVPAGQDALLVATGTGLAPYMSMLRTELVREANRRFVVLHGARYSWDLGYRMELTILARQHANLLYLPVISRGRDDASWNGLTGYLQDVLFSGTVEARTGIPVTPGLVHVFLCGNPGMITAVKEGLITRGFTPDKGRTIGDIHTEEYW